MFDPIKNFEKTKKLVGYKSLKDMSEKDYDALGFMSGLEVHQQLKTEKKLFCRCPAGHYQKAYDYDSEVIRHMRPTLSELGEYDGTALMEFRTRKNITYRIKYKTACTYDIDDTPPFLMNKEALKVALEIALLMKENIVGELHITRKQYLDGSIPTGFQRTGIIGVAGEFSISKKTIRLIQMSIEEDSCREVSDIGHERIYRTDRLGMPLVEVVTHPDMKTPWEVAEACQMIRYIARSTGKVRVGSGASRQDVNVSVRGGCRVEIKGVSQITLIPTLTHHEAFRQKALLLIQEELTKRVKNPKEWHLDFVKLALADVQREAPQLAKRLGTLNELNKGNIVAVNLPKFEGLLSFFIGPNRCFASEISDRLKVIACLEKPNMICCEDFDIGTDIKEYNTITKALRAKDGDSQIIFIASDDDVKTTIETIKERCELAFDGVPHETRKAMVDGATLFERVLPGADRMYPDTDSAPIPISEELIAEVGSHLPRPLNEELEQLKKWKVPSDTYTYLLRNNLMEMVRRIIEEFNVSPVFVTTVLAHRLKNLQGKIKQAEPFDVNKVYGLFKFVHHKKLEVEIIKDMLPHVWEHPQIDFESVLTLMPYKPTGKKALQEDIPILINKFNSHKRSKRPNALSDWLMGQLRKPALGSYPLAKLRKLVEEGVHDN
ncbi:MAG: Glu-tRNA(Gln) amidotransferase subunit GatE [bacterium]|nr:Glu-tRNA(Gln) amidotransferase subunit GatE [bacterium]